jgi:hypothetical protein
LECPRNCETTWIGTPATAVRHGVLKPTWQDLRVTPAAQLVSDQVLVIGIRAKGLQRVFLLELLKRPQVWDDRRKIERPTTLLRLRFLFFRLSIDRDATPRDPYGAGLKVDVFPLDPA